MVIKIRKICVITGTRAEYGLLKSTMDVLSNSPNIDLSLLVGGMHLESEFGKTIDLINKDGFEINGIFHMSPEDDLSSSMSLAIAEGIREITNKLRKLNPDIILILGDRIEALSAAISAAYMNIFVAHIHGGDKTKAGLDESTRHAITKFSHIHFPATEKSAMRIIKMGEAKSNVFTVGAPGLDSIVNQELYTRKEILKLYDINLDSFIILLQHSVTTQSESSKFQIDQTLKALEELKIPVIIIYPNSDSGGRIIINQIETLRGRSFVKVFKNLPRKDYLSLLKYASVMVGNSSSGIIESSIFQLPVVNIGIRQNGREKSDNVVTVNHDSNEIKRAILRLIGDDFRKRLNDSQQIYGNGKAGEKIAKVLMNKGLNFDLMQKSITY